MSSPPPPLPEPPPADSTSPADPTPPAAATGPVWHRMHPITPALNAWKVIAALLVMAAWQIGPDRVEEWDLEGGRAIAIVLAFVLVGGLIGTVYSAIAWRVTRYAVDAEKVYLQSGILYRRQRQARLDRIQAVDVVQPLLARLVGLSQLTIEQAGGQDSRVVLAFLTEARAQELRNEILARAAGLDLDEAEASTGSGAPPPRVAGPPLPDGAAYPFGAVAGATGSPVGAAATLGTPSSAGMAGPLGVPRLGRAAPEAPEREVYAVPVARVLGSIALSGAMVTLVLIVLAIATGALATRTFAVFGLVFPALIGSVGYVWGRFTSEFAFRAAISPDGIRLRHGLTEARAQTVPPGRVQAVRLSQPLFWRGMDWWRVEINVAGYADANGSKENVLLPVGTRDEAMTALWMVLPDLGEDPLPVLAAALTGRDAEAAFVATPRRARWLDLVGWRRNGWRVTPEALLLRRGRLRRQVDVVPHERMQSLGLAQGPLQRWFGVSSLVVHSTPGPVTPRVDHLDAATAADLIMVQAERARTARAGAGPEQWMRRRPALG